MFDHITLLLSFVFAVALTHLMASTTELLLNRERVRFSWLHATWMMNALVGLLVNWLGLWGLTILKHWTPLDVLLQFVPAMIQYFTCSLVSMRVEPEGPVDMGAFFQRQRLLIGGAFAAMMVTSMIQNYVYRGATEGVRPTDWIAENLLVAPMLIAALICGWAKPQWLQWIGALGMLALESYFLATFAVTD